MKRILSLGLGVQSTAIYLMSSMGQMPRLDAAIFADLGKEKQGTYDYLIWLLNWQKENDGIPIHVINEKDLYKDLINKTNSTKNTFASIPAYTKNKDGSTGMLRRQCTNEYKIAQVDKLVRYKIYEMAARKRLPRTEIWKGISMDEITRMSIPDEKWKILIHPFIGWITFAPGKATKMEEGVMVMRRYQIENWYRAHDLPIPPKSACVFCPFQSERSWYEMKTQTPDDFEAACLVDEAIRNSSKQGVKSPIYLHEKCIPLREVVFTADAPDLWSGDCSGTCHN